MFNVIVPMAGEGSRFLKDGITVPKPFIAINNEPMFFRAIKNFIGKDCKFIFIIRDSHLQHFDIDLFLSKYNINYKIIIQEGGRLGPSDTLSLCIGNVENLPTFFIDCDQQTHFDIDKTLEDSVKFSGGVVTFNSNSNKYSYVQSNDNIMTRIEEKIQISEDACSGVYFWNNFNEYVKYYESTIWEGKSEKYISDVYKTALLDGKKFFVLKSEAYSTYGTPDDLRAELDKG
jgi:dTDP-glucose pyrophosphorylase